VESYLVFYVFFPGSEVIYIRPKIDKNDYSKGVIMSYVTIISNLKICLAKSKKKMNWLPTHAM